MLKHKKHYEYILNIQSLEWFTILDDNNKNLISTFLSNLDPLTYYMLEGRFIKSTKKIKSQAKDLPSSPVLDKLFEQLEYTKATKKKGQTINLLDVIKGYKILEQQLYHNGNADVDSIDELDIGDYKNCLVKASDSITTLFICIRNTPGVQARAMLSIMHTGVCIYRQFSVKAKTNSSTITGRYSGSMSIEEAVSIYFTDENIDRFINKFLDRSKLTNFDELFIYSGNASSPNSGHSNVNYLADAAGLYKDKLLFLAVCNLAECFKNGYNLVNIVEILIANIADDDQYSKDKEHSRLVTFTAPGGKSRIIAVADWITQTALSAIHKTQFQLLRMIPADRTFDHKSGLDLYDPDAESYISVDLSAATDRLPRVLQARIISRLFTILGMEGELISRYWLATIDRKYSTKNSYLEKESPYIQYEVGQGMGLFSSWSSMALMHHFIVSELCGVDQNNYRLVGDDLLLRNSDKEYEMYNKIFCELGVSINPSKTLKSTKSPFTLEFARNYIIEGHKISPLPSGVVFSYYDGKLSESEVFYNFLETLDFVDYRKILKYLKIEGFTELHIIAYFLWREKVITHLEVEEVIKQGGHKGTLFSEKALISIKDLCKSEPRPSTLRRQISFVESLLSQCTMRRPEDLEKITSLGKEFTRLKYSGEEIEDYSEVMTERILNATPVCYLPGLGNPTATKAEKRLITDFVDYLTKTDKNKKNLIAAIKTYRRRKGTEQEI
jgi:hypothetical protein